MLFVLIAALTASSQITGTIQGTVNDETGKGIASATVALLKDIDSALVKMAVSDGRGAFVIEGAKEGRYRVAVTNVGYRKAASALYYG